MKQKIEVSSLSALFIAFSLVIGNTDKVLLAYASMILHELGHITTASIFKKRTKKIRVLLVGVNARIDLEDCSGAKRIAILLAGPLINILIVVASLLVERILLSPEDLHYIRILNLYLFCFNLLPMLPLDGGEILRELLTKHFGLLHGSLYLRKTSYFFSVAFILFGILQGLSYPGGFLFIIFGIYSIINLKLGYSEAASMNIKKLMFRQTRLLKKGIYGARVLVVLQTVTLGAVLKSMDFDQYHFVYVLDQNLRLINMINESQLIEAMMKYNMEITIEEYLKEAGSPE